MDDPLVLLSCLELGYWSAWLESMDEFIFQVELIKQESSLHDSHIASMLKLQCNLTTYLEDTYYRSGTAVVVRWCLQWRRVKGN
ncbi:PREDICTED: uncharacterized protein LOC104605703 isoform X4 [Nelumbo nucifera]|uniref:Uncharacterized protein LOC104605703 isoform X4 n=1 Tax=Nelumbo nucifera TaxID=4432 RepID=A0A1U8B057_NELNU|nr:PREDICTED: uncharacterized protein LOC104605703 isoform X4 [Nelumbo nucifera]